MTETDTSRIVRPCPNCGVTLNGWSSLRHCGHYTTHAHADCINNLRHRAEKAEAERDQWAARSGKHMAERDTAWNDAIEAAAEYHHNFLITKTWADVKKVIASTTAIRALRKGEPT